MLTLSIAFTLSLIVPLALVLLSFVLSSYPQDHQEFLTPFECGFDPDSTARIPFSLRFFLLAVIFLVFDVEIALLTPFPLIMSSFPINELILPFSLFIVVLMLGLLHE
jgi:NADH-ubiquinone oxidoreductase chain 3